MKKTGLRIRITRPGWLFILLSLGVGLAALNTGNNLLYLIFGTMLSFLILSGLLSNNTLQKLRVTPLFPHRIFAGEPVLVRVDLENRKRWIPSFALSLAAKAKNLKETERTFILKVSPRSLATAVNRVTFPRRGREPLPPYSAETFYPFGLIAKSLSVPSVGETVVYPARIDLEPWISRERHLQGEFLSGEKGGSTHPYGIRDFVDGDSARLIHWKSSARRGEWKVKEFEKEKRLRVVLDVVLSSVEHSQPSLLEKALSVSGSLLLELFDAGIEVSLRLNGEPISGSGRSCVDAYLSALALATPPTHIKSVRTSESGTTVVVSDLPQSQLHGDIIWGREKLDTL